MFSPQGRKAPNDVLAKESPIPRRVAGAGGPGRGGGRAAQGPVPFDDLLTGDVHDIDGECSITA